MDNTTSAISSREVRIPSGRVWLQGDLAQPLVMVGKWHNKVTELVKILAKP